MVSVPKLSVTRYSTVIGKNPSESLPLESALRLLPRLVISLDSFTIWVKLSSFLFLLLSYNALWIVCTLENDVIDDCNKGPFPK